MIRVGKLTLDISEPYPCWCVLRHEDHPGMEIRLRHGELSDLRYCASKGAQAARLKLGKDAVEV